ncbi:PulJ/GspJ family protein [Hankyongella ginsenosidimutans]|nr:type II secretion system protein [Hankyongella ginsenosidimutans]
MMRRGLTLVELLVSLAIVGLISVMLASGLGVAQKTRLQLDRARNDGDDVVAVQNMLRTLIEQLYPLNTSSGDSRPRIDVYGDGRRVFSCLRRYRPSGRMRCIAISYRCAPTAIWCFPAPARLRSRSRSRTTIPAVMISMATHLGVSKFCCAVSQI